MMDELLVPGEVMTTVEAAKMLRYSRSTIKRMVEQKELRAFGSGRRRRIAKEDVVGIYTSMFDNLPNGKLK